MPNPKRQRPRKLHTRSVVSVAFSVEEGQIVSRAASAKGQPVSTFIREAAIAAIARENAPSKPDTTAAA